MIRLDLVVNVGSYRLMEPYWPLSNPDPKREPDPRPEEEEEPLVLMLVMRGSYGLK